MAARELDVAGAVGAVADIESVDRILKVTGLVNVADGFDDAPAVMDGCSKPSEQDFPREVRARTVGHGHGGRLRSRHGDREVVALSLLISDRSRPKGVSTS
jgi:hypothetical protein